MAWKEDTDDDEIELTEDILSTLLFPERVTRFLGEIADTDRPNAFRGEPCP